MIQNHLQNYQHNTDSLVEHLLYFCHTKPNDFNSNQLNLLQIYHREKKQATNPELYERKINALLNRMNMKKIIDYIRENNANSTNKATDRMFTVSGDTSSF